MRGLGVILGSTVLILALILQPALAEEKDYSNEPWETAGLYVGPFLVNFNSNLDLGFGGRGIGVTVDGEELLGLDEDLDVFRADAFWRIARRHRIDLMNISKDNSDDLLTEIDMSYAGLLLYAKFYF